MAGSVSDDPAIGRQLERAAPPILRSGHPKSASGDATAHGSLVVGRY